MAVALIETQVRENVFVWTLGGDSIHTSFGTNCVGIIGSSGVLLVDPLIVPAHARLVEAALRRKTAAPIKFVVLTHHHTDHSLGSSWFAERGAAVIAHRACRERMAIEHPGLIEARRRNPEIRDLFADARSVLPSIAFEQGLTLYIDGQEIEVRHAGWGHTPGDAIVFIREQRLAICGDLLFVGYHYNYEDASLAGARRGLEMLRALDADTFVPGHGPVSGAGMLETQARYHDAVEAVVRHAAESGRDDEFIALSLRDRFPDYRLEIAFEYSLPRLRAHARERDSGAPTGTE